MLLSNFGLGIDYMVMALAPTLGWLFVGRVVSGITSASIPTAMAYIADVTDPKKRAEAFGMVSAAFGLGFVLGPALGGVLGNVSPRLPFWVAGGMSLLNAMYGLFVLPESLPREHRGIFSWKQANPLGSLTLLRRHRELFGMGCVLLLSYLTQQSLVNTWVLYTDYRYQWSARAVGLSLALVGVGSVIVGALLVRPLVKWLGQRQHAAVGAGDRLGRVCHLRPGADGMAVPAGDSADEPVGAGRADGAGADERARDPAGAGAVAGGGAVHPRADGAGWAGAVHVCVCRGDQAGTDSSAGGAVSAGGGILLSALPVAAMVTRKEA